MNADNERSPAVDAASAATDPASTESVSINTKEARERWARELGTTGEALEGAVLAVGTRIDRIKDYLTAGMAHHQQGG